MEREGASSKYSSQPSLKYPHRNSGLFSDHFLEKTLPDQPGWEQLGQEAEAVRVQVAKIFADYTPTDNEAQTERDLIRPVLEELGHETFEVQPALYTPGGVKRPDYVFYRDEAGLASGKNVTLTEELIEGRAFAVGDAKYFDRPMDMSLKRRGDAFSNQNPSFQISFYMRYSGVQWGILTNGRLWRLYHKDSAHRLDRFYEVDLSEVLDWTEAFLYFYAFFRRGAFEEGPLGLDSVLSGSVDYARGVGDSLKNQVYEALRHLAQGFLDYPSNALTTEPETLREIYDASLIALYRMLFILYAESRELLPVDANDEYRDSYSLYAIKHQAANNLERGRRLVARRAKLWPQLTELFGIIAEGSPPLSVATFNGGLFDPERHPFLERYSVGDLHLQQAIDHLARVDGGFVDYRDLAERHLGTIYEGLLEFHLRATDEQAEEGWSVELLNDKGERHRTGSYYTPDYIVSYMVDQAVGPVLAEAVEGKSTAEEKIEAILATDVLDPAMGSGHFLVEATEYIARFLVELGVSQEAGGEVALGIDSEAELVYWKRRVVQSCVYGVDLNPLAVELAKLSLWLSTVARHKPLSFLDHHLRAGNSLVGASVEDVGPGRASKKRGRSPGEGQIQLSLLPDEAFRRSMSAAVEDMWRIEDNPADSVGEVKEQERIYAELKEALSDRYRRYLDLATISRMEPERKLENDRSAWMMLAEHINGESDRLPVQVEGWLEEAQEAAGDHSFFHWELEFPEVFFDRHGRPLGIDAGFEAVVGNPPYVRQERFAAIKPYLRESFYSFHSVADLYLYFYEQGIKLLRQLGRLGYISSGTFARANFATAFRRFLPTMAQMDTIIDFGENQPFEDAEMVRPSITILEKKEHNRPFKSLLIEAGIPGSLAQAVADYGAEPDTATLYQSEWVFQSAELTHLFQKISAVGRPLSEKVSERMYYGIKTGLNKAFVIDQATRDRLVDEESNYAQILRPILQGEDLRPWYQEDEGRWLIAMPSGWTVATFGEGLTESRAWEKLQGSYGPVAEYLRPFWEAGRKRSDQGEYSWELRACGYYDEFDTQKIFWPDIAKLPRMSWSDSGAYMGNTGFMISRADPALLGILNSRVMWFAISQVCQPLRLRAGLWQYRLLPQFMSRLPVPDVPDEIHQELSQVSMKLTRRAVERYELHGRARRRILTDFGGSECKLNQRLTHWWKLDFPAFRRELKKVFKQDIPVAERDEWEDWLSVRCSEHEHLTAEIIQLEKQLNDHVYTLFDLSAEESAIIEESTRYQYGEV